jgi:Protein of unknown function (DUF1559)
MRTAVLLLIASGLALAAPVPKDEVKLKPATDAQREEVKTNLKILGLALHNFHDAMGYFPTDIVDAKTKKPLLSWRVALLPYFEEDDLYTQFKLDEPWDSKANLKLAEKLPKIYAPTRAKAKPGETFYRGFGGKGEFAGLFEPGARVTMSHITDGTSNTIAVIDAGEPVVWTKPDTDIPNDPKAALPKLGAMIDDDYYCLMCDGSVRTVKRVTDEKVLRAMISRAGGEVVTLDDAP